jgi:hypothetical protein
MSETTPVQCHQSRKQLRSQESGLLDAQNAVLLQFVAQRRAVDVLDENIGDRGVRAVAQQPRDGRVRVAGQRGGLTAQGLDRAGVLDLVRASGLEDGRCPECDRPDQPGLATMADAEAFDGECSAGQFAALGPVPYRQSVLGVCLGVCLFVG